MAIAVYEVTAPGFDGGDDSTDDRVIWLIVDIPTGLDDLQQEAARLGGVFHPDPLVGDHEELLAAADFAWPNDLKAFRAVMRHFARNLPTKRAV